MNRRTIALPSSLSITWSWLSFFLGSRTVLPRATVVVVVVFTAPALAMVVGQGQDSMQCRPLPSSSLQLELVHCCYYYYYYYHHHHYAAAAAAAAAVAAAAAAAATRTSSSINGRRRRKSAIASFFLGKRRRNGRGPRVSGNKSFNVYYIPGRRWPVSIHTHIHERERGRINYILYCH